MKAILVATALLALAGCASAVEMSLVRKVSLLTHGRCTHTTELRAQLDQALTTLGLPLEYEYLDVTSLPEDDIRLGYAMPTILVGERDLFGSAVPTPPLPGPT